MKKIIQTLFVICFLIVLIIPILRFNRHGTISEVENRTLATRPYLFIDSHFNENLFSELSTYFDDRFGCRLYLIRLQNKINQSLNKYNTETQVFLQNEKAIQGKNGFYFYIEAEGGDNIADFNKVNVIQDQLDFIRLCARNINSWCIENGIKCIFVICPNKHSVYSDYYPFPRPQGLTRSDYIIKIFQEEGCEYVFPRDHLINMRKSFKYPLYYETDTHWNQAGAYIAFMQLQNKIEELFPDISFPKIEYKTDISYTTTFGDLLSMIGLEESKCTKITMTPKGNKISDFYKYIKNDGYNGIITIGVDNKLPRALIYRDSFFEALEPFVSPMFYETEYVWKQFTDADKEKVLQYNPDILIIECIERFTPTFIDFKN